MCLCSQPSVYDYVCECVFSFVSLFGHLFTCSVNQINFVGTVCFDVSTTVKGDFTQQIKGVLEYEAELNFYSNFFLSLSFFFCRIHIDTQVFSLSSSHPCILHTCTVSFCHTHMHAHTHAHTTHTHMQTHSLIYTLTQYVCTQMYKHKPKAV